MEKITQQKKKCSLRDMILGTTEMTALGLTLACSWCVARGGAKSLLARGRKEQEMILVLFHIGIADAIQSVA